MEHIVPFITPEHPEKSHPVANRLQRDFYLSFMFSQGNLGQQRIIFRYLAAYYRIAFSDDEKEELAAWKAAPYEGRHVFMPPAGHEPMNPASARHTVQQERSRFTSELYMVTSPAEPYLPQLEREVSDAAHAMIQRDTAYQHPTHPRPDPADPHKSYFREYVVRATPTTSAAMDSYIAALRSSVHANTAGFADELTTLETAWTRQHPGESFYGPEAGPDLRSAR